MIAVDTNVLVYAHITTLPYHERARRLVTDLAEGNEPWGLPVFCIGEFLRVVTHTRLFDRPYTGQEAWDAVHELLQAPTLRVLTPGRRFLPLLGEALEESGATGNLVFDALVVGVCREAGVRSLLTEDRDFARFPGFPTRPLKREGPRAVGPGPDP